MATTVAELNCAENCGVQLYHQKVEELTCAIVRGLPDLYRTAFRRMGNLADAEDAVQDALLSAYSHVNQFRGQARMSTWLTAIVLNSARMALRRRSRQFNVPLDEGDQDARCLLDIVSDPRPGPEEECRRAEGAELLVQALARLSPILRQAFQLRDIDGLSIRETAQTLGVPDETVKTRLSRARAKLKKLLQKSLGGHVMRCEGSAVTSRHGREGAIWQVDSNNETTPPKCDAAVAMASCLSL